MALSQKQIDWLTNSIIKNLENGEIAWRSKWFNLNHQNPETGTIFSGINPFFLSSHAKMHGYKSNYWVTYKGAKRKGWKVNPGFKPCPIIYMKKCQWNKENKDGEKEKVAGFVSKLYTVINCDFVDLPEKLNNQKRSNILQKPEQVKNQYLDREKIELQEFGNQAYYSPKQDKISIPTRSQFKNDQKYYEVIFHEMIHSTGHKKRLSRVNVTNFDRFASEAYSIEELIAEMGSVFTLKHCGLDPEINSSTAYIKSWLKVLKNNKDWIIKASRKANKAYQYIIKGDKC